MHMFTHACLGWHLHLCGCVPPQWCPDGEPRGCRVGQFLAVVARVGWDIFLLDARTPWATEGHGEDTPGVWGPLCLLEEVHFPHSQLRSPKKGASLPSKLPRERPLDVRASESNHSPCRGQRRALLQEVMINILESDRPGFESHSAAPQLCLLVSWLTFLTSTASSVQ